MQTPIHSTLLSECHNGQVCQIVSLSGSLELKMRLINLGFHTHSIVETILSRGQNIVISVDGSRFAIDKEIAEYIQVEPLA
ncbi:FeoA family protein [Thiomicrorhabdus sp.]|uniref:FeoA family protein n=1 Tax=Thiomicrorhabdus sp. TaxID=2039724 RepID=UPI002AA68C4A|nr:FeoA family protein [Thiomicrorhabdus sp.]